jgi:glucokinase
MSAVTADLPQGAVGLVGDIGGTNARFALAQQAGGRTVLQRVLTLPGKNYPSLEAAAQDYLASVGNPPLHAAVAACAGPVIEGSVSFTNLAWATTERAFGAAIGLPRVRLLNDLAAVAWAAPALEGAGLRRIAHTGTLATPAPPLAQAGRATRAILNAGTGCNASAFVQNESGQAVVVGEYGHASFAPVNDLEVQIWRRLHAMYGRVSIERVLCGPGLLNLYRALCDIEDAPAPCQTPAAVSQAAAAGDAQAHQAVAHFCALMGSVAGDVALCFGARGGVFLAGGVAAMLMTEPFDTSFRERFEDKGRFRTYLADIPTQLICDTNVALLGAARAMGTLAADET